MAFVTGVSLGARRTQNGVVVGAQHELSLNSLRAAPAVALVRMGYGDYKFSSTSITGYVDQYNVDKFRNLGSFANAAYGNVEARLGTSKKGKIVVPKEGIPQVPDGELAFNPDDPNSPVDPRVSEISGELYSWDKKCQEQVVTFADLDEPEVAQSAFSAFRSSLAAERSAALAQKEAGAEYRVSRILEGVNEARLLTVDGQHEVTYARLQEIADIPYFTSSGEPQTQIPGKPFLRSVGAMDFQVKPKRSIYY